MGTSKSDWNCSGYGRRRRRVRRRRIKSSVIMPSGQSLAVRRKIVRRRVVRLHPLVRRRRLVRRRAVGGSLRSSLSSAHGFIRNNRLVSKGLSQFGHAKLASAASSLGYGRRRRRAPIRRRRGGANFFSTEQLAAPIF